MQMLVSADNGYNNHNVDNDNHSDSWQWLMTVLMTVWMVAKMIYRWWWWYWQQLWLDNDGVDNEYGDVDDGDVDNDCDGVDNGEVDRDDDNDYGGVDNDCDEVDIDDILLTIM